jgi:hypothetical protein
VAKGYIDHQYNFDMQVQNYSGQGTIFSSIEILFTNPNNTLTYSVLPTNMAPDVLGYFMCGIDQDVYKIDKYFSGPKNVLYIKDF